MLATFRAAVLAAAALLTLGAARPPESEPVRYRLTPVVDGAGLTALEIEIRFRGDADGETRLNLPNRWAGEAELWRHLSALEVDGATVEAPRPAVRILKHRPGAALTVRYRVTSAYSEDPRGDRNPFRPIVRPGWFHVLGETVFAIPEDGTRPADFAWGPVPRGWTLASDLEHGRMGRALVVHDVAESVSLGGPDVKVEERPIPGGRLRVAVRGDWAFDEKEFVDLTARVIGAERAFWNDTSGPYFVSLIPVVANPGEMHIGGTGRSDAFSLYATPDAEGAELRMVLGHEHVHTWVPGRIGRMPEKGWAVAYWFSEGFTDFQAYRSLLRSGVWSLDEFVQMLNDKLGAYATSTVREAPNSRIVSDYWTDAAVKDLPYQRGMLLALVWDARLRQATEGRRDLDDVLLAMRDARQKAAEPPLAAELFATTYRDLSGIDLAADYDRYVDKGATVLLPADLFGACAQVRTETLPAFDRGYDPDATAAAGNVVTGLRADSPAYAAGLRDGMKVVKREGGQPGDARAEYVLRVSDDGGERLIRFQPVGKGEVTRQTVVLAPGLDEAARAACARSMSGA